MVSLGVREERVGALGRKGILVENRKGFWALGGSRCPVLVSLLSSLVY